MTLISVPADRIPEAASTLARAMLDEPGGRWLLPDEDEFLDVHRQLYVAMMTRAMNEGRVDAWGDPFVAVALWFERPALDEEPSAAESPSPPLRFPEHAKARVEQADAMLSSLRERVRSDHHVYLDSIGVLPDQRRHGVATQLLEIGFAWADEKELPVSLDTLDPANVTFYQKRGFEVVATGPVAGSTLTVTSMRRPVRIP